MLHLNIAARMPGGGNVSEDIARLREAVVKSDVIPRLSSALTAAGFSDQMVFVEMYPLPNGQ